MVVTNLKNDLDRLAQPIEAAGISIGLVDQAGREHYFHYGTIGWRSRPRLSDVARSTGSGNEAHLVESRGSRPGLHDVARSTGSGNEAHLVESRGSRPGLHDVAPLRGPENVDRGDHLPGLGVGEGGAASGLGVLLAASVSALTASEAPARLAAAISGG
jgi:hypothetical protein